MAERVEPVVEPKTLAEWRRWLARNHASEQGVWLRFRGRGVQRMAIGYDKAVEEALCYGWIDGQYRPGSGTSMIRFSPRRPGSGWARSNRERVERLIADGRMRPAGLTKVQAAKRDGSWSMLETVERLEVPADLKRALGARGAKRFDALTPSKRREHLYALVTAKLPATRAKRIAAIAASLR